MNERERAIGGGVEIVFGVVGLATTASDGLNHAEAKEETKDSPMSYGWYFDHTEKIAMPDPLAFAILVTIFSTSIAHGVMNLRKARS